MRTKLLVLVVAVSIISLATYGFLKEKKIAIVETSDIPIAKELPTAPEPTTSPKKSLTKDKTIPVASKFSPVVTKSYTETFASSEIDKSQWDIFVTEGVTAQNNSNKNLQFSISSGGIDNKQRAGTASFKSQIGEGKDFIIETMIEKPRIDGNGDTLSGIKFYSDKQTGAEIVSLKWVVNAKNSSKIIMKVVNEAGKLVEVGSANVTSDQIKLRLVRAQNAYRGVYFVNNDPDTERVIVGEEPANKNIGGAGYLALFTSNHSEGDVSQNFPKVEAQFDNATIEWQEGTGHVWKGIYDAFKQGAINPDWDIQKNNGISIANTSEDKLTFNADPLTSDTVKYRDGWLFTKTITPKNVDFIATAVINKPLTYGDGIVTTGIDFSPIDNSNDQGIAIRWRIEKGSNKELCKLLLVVHDANRKLIRSQEVDIPIPTPWVTVQLSRTEGNKYRAQYKLSGNDVDVPWKNLGNPETITMGSVGKFGLFTVSASSGTLPAFSSQIDFFSAAWPLYE